MSLEGQQLGEFEILERLGQGGMGAVYKARQRSLKRLVALKTLQANLAEDTEYIARFEQEAVAAAGLMHPNLVQVFSAGENDGLHWFAMEYVPGESAKVRLKRKGRLDPLEAIAIAIHVATALEYGWRKAHLIHRDIKPDNIFLSEDGEVKLGDLGLAKSAGQTTGLTMTGHSMGTPHYISPEQVESTKDVDLRADIYSLGCTLFHLLSGQVPFDGNSAVAIMMKHVTAPVPRLKAAWPECPQALDEVVGKMMEKNPADRPQDYATVIADLRQAYEVVSNPDTPPTVVPEPTPPPQAAPPPAAAPKPRAVAAAAARPTKAKNSKFLVYAGFTGVVLALAAGWYFLSQGAKEKMTVANNSVNAETTSNPKVIKLWDSPDKLPSSQQALWQDGAIHLNEHESLTYNELLARDVILRASIQFNSDRDSPQLIVRNIENNNSYYRISLARGSLDLQEMLNGVADRIAQWPLPRTYSSDEWANVELRAIGDELTVSVDGVILGQAHNKSIDSAGAVGIYANNHGHFRNIEYTPLDKPTGEMEGARPATATKDSPFVNSLGMKFVPVPGTKVLFSIWDTRVQDYKVYATAKTVDDTWTRQEKEGVPVSREPDDPVVGVSWEDAQGFIQWLTNKELADGKLPKGAKYRLPTDEEWSIAVGLPLEQGATPADKRGKNTVNFPWGIGFPPPAMKIGNYADATWHGKFPTEHWVEGYTDGYVTTSPVGSFPANPYGLYDLGGNVWQWCEDWYDAMQKERVLRGACWNSEGRMSLLSSQRDHALPTYRISHDGFRCVLAPAGAPAVSAGSPETATKDTPFVNNLGMKFVPVPVGGGPTVGQKVLFSVWDTRVQDYGAYAAANPKVSGFWKNQNKDGTPVSRETDDPVTGVTWEDAQAYCQWLTAREQADGKIPQEMQYRLPSDEEWSWAVGLPLEAGATPMDKNWNRSEDFPWGKDYPPSGKVGNYPDESFHAKFPPKKQADGSTINDWIAGYDDGYPTVSPVGSFPANRYGLCDMGGNVFQWCEDWYEPSHSDRVLRGASWNYADRKTMRSASRIHYVPTHSAYDAGFRCVLARVRANVVTTTTPEKATKDLPFVNTLGMQFVPVPGTKVLFSIWDTRVRDYQAYSREASLIDTWIRQEKEGIPVSREPEDPVVGVSWLDAEAFLRWLTMKDSDAGKLPKGARYRLPKDEEWSVAVGLSTELGTTPAEKNEKNGVDFPWGREYPPARANLGNYADESFHATFPPRKRADGGADNSWIEGYTDGSATTSPVGSFPPNAYGLYDMGGNVWQWCDDWFDAANNERVLRGASWSNGDRSMLLSSHRYHSVPGYRGNSNGFRCVLELPGM